ncbi:hypothetical protein [Stenotrophomonas sp. MYb57]|uniref:hypothetical protein n=1 Tax=Stenotrophomonas sp. MYb57 TaxID=1827305 RepID=UPI00131A3141|nr:hypothetical protein [Stenotrophomonas sp. MYb57]
MSDNGYATYDLKRAAVILSRVEGGDPVRFADRQISVLQTGAWFEAVRLSVGSNESWRPLTAYAVGKYVEPMTYIPGKDGYTSNKWSRYAAGIHRPTPRTLDQLDLLAPGARDWIDPLHWRLLNCSRALHDDDDGLRRLAPAIFDTLFDRAAGDHRRLKTKALQDLCLDELAAHVNGIEALCAAVWVLREALENSDQRTCLEVGAHLHNILLMTVSFGVPFLIRTSLIAFFHRHIFPLASSIDVIINPSLADLLATADDFLVHLTRLEDDGGLGDQRLGDTSEWRMMLDGSLGDDLCHSLSPGYELRPGSTSVGAAAFVASRTTLKVWGKGILDSGSRQRAVPKAVRRQICGFSFDD